MISLKEAARQLGCSPDNLRARIKAGTFKATKVGTRGWFTTEEEIERYRKYHRRAP